MSKELEQMQELKNQATELNNKISELKKTLKDKAVKGWSPKGGGWYIIGSGLCQSGYSTEHFRLHGSEFKTKEQAKKASKSVRLWYWQYQLALELNDGWVADWSDRGNDKCEVYYNHNEQKYDIYESPYEMSFSSLFFKDVLTAQKAIEIMENWSFDDE